MRLSGHVAVYDAPHIRRREQFRLLQQRVPPTPSQVNMPSSSTPAVHPVEPDRQDIEARLRGLLAQHQGLRFACLGSVDGRVVAFVGEDGKVFVRGIGAERGDVARANVKTKMAKDTSAAIGGENFVEKITFRARGGRCNEGCEGRL